MRKYKMTPEKILNKYGTLVRPHKSEDSDCFLSYFVKNLCAGHMPLVPAPSRQRQMSPCEFKTNLVYIVNSTTARDA